MFAVILALAFVDLDPYVAIGGDAPKTRYPFMVQLQQFLVVSYVHHCGGSLLTASYILTAAHCATDSLQLQAQAGTVWRNSNEQGQRRDILRMVAHERFIQDGTTGPYDIALATVDEPFAVDGVNVAILPLLPHYYQHPNTTEVVGFGKIDHDDTLPDRLRFVRCNLHAPDECKRDDMVGSFCVGTPGATACQGDSGGPVVGTIDGVDWLVGLVSHGLKVCGTGPIICTDVNFYGNWINEVIHRMSLDSEESE
uniref:Peptidase S1 domain-containing protein n=1 Tax=Anopheles culicifacies TaxID=139723 RepID=A0A182MDR0_9DIPT